jgi:hypothetical protein
MGKVTKVPPTYSERIASHNPDLNYDVQDPDGRTKKLFLQHPDGTRKQRRYKQRHHPYFTKRRHRGREWFGLMK